LNRITSVARPVVLFVAPIVVTLALVIYADLNVYEPLSNTLPGRLLVAGRILSDLDAGQVFGLHASDIKIGVQFAMNPVTDSGYAYVLTKIGLVGALALWAMIVYAPVGTRDTRRFKNFVALYLMVLLSISASVFTIKTAALLWFLYGTLSNPYGAFGPFISSPAAKKLGRFQAIG
jgi:putative polymerase